MFKLYWTDKDGITNGKYSADLMTALQLSETLRKAGNTFVTMVSENPNSVGKPGVDSIQGGKCPSGEMYGWSKRRSAA